MLILSEMGTLGKTLRIKVFNTEIHSQSKVKSYQLVTGQNSPIVGLFCSVNNLVAYCFDVGRWLCTEMVQLHICSIEQSKIYRCLSIM